MSQKRREVIVLDDSDSDDIIAVEPRGSAANLRAGGSHLSPRMASTASQPVASSSSQSSSASGRLFSSSYPGPNTKLQRLISDLRRDGRVVPTPSRIRGSSATNVVRPREIIELLSDDEDERPPAKCKVDRVSPPLRSNKPAELPKADEDEDYETLYDGFNVSVSGNWKPHDHRDDGSLPSLRAMTALSPGHSRIDTHFTSRTTRRFAVEPGQLPGITFPLTTETRKRKFPWITNMSSAQGAQRRGVKALLPEYHVSSQFGAAPASAAFRLAGGAINKIIQRPGYIALSSATAGGQPDQTQNPGQPPDPYNRDGTLQTWKDGDPSSVILHGHCTFEEPPTPSQWHPGQQAVEVPCRKCYTVNDISFDPNRKDIMASAGNDGFVQLWLDGRKLDDAYYEYPQAPHDVVYRPSDSLLAVTCRDGIVYVHSTRSRSQLGDPVVLRVAPPHARHSVGAIAWGRAASADMLFASSEPQSEEDCNGFHVAFNPDRGTRRVIEFSAEESGDAMAVDPEGGRLALCTTGEGATHAMRIYDVRRKDGRRAIQEVQLDTFHPPPLSDPSVPFHDEVKSMAFSPDGVLLVVARSDDEVHVYDSRFMQRGREPISRFLHWDEDSCTPGGYRWGVVDAVWVDGWCGRGLGIVSGGTDGCIRFWDVRRSDDVSLNGEVLARSNYDIGHFSVGDPRIGERSLIVGDNGGRVYVYDYTATGHLRHFSP